MSNKNTLLKVWHIQEKNNFTKVAKNLAKDKKDENNFARLSK